MSMSPPAFNRAYFIKFIRREYTIISTVRIAVNRRSTRFEGTLDNF